MVGSSVETTILPIRPESTARRTALATNGTPSTVRRFFAGIPFEPPRAGITHSQPGSPTVELLLSDPRAVRRRLPVTPTPDRFAVAHPPLVQLAATPAHPTHPRPHNIGGRDLCGCHHRTLPDPLCHHGTPIDGGSAGTSD